MNRKKLFWISLTSCALVILLGFAVAPNLINNSVVGARTVPATPPNGHTVSPSNPTPYAMQPGPAYIKPSIQSSDPSVITISKDEVRQNLLKYPQWGQIQSLKVQTILDIELTTSGQASNLLGDVSIGLPDSAPVYLVKIAGSFSIPAPPLPNSNNSALTTMPIAHKVFDAHTGYLLIEGTGGPYDK